MAKKAIAFIEVEGVQEITKYTQIQIEQNLFGHHEFQIQVPIESIEGEGSFVFEKAKKFIGKVVRINLESDLLVDTKSPVFVGIITDIGFVRTFGSGNDLLFKGKSTTVLLDNGKNYRTFSEKSLSDIIKEVMKGYPENLLSCKADPAFTSPIPYIVQYNESNFNFLQRIADRYCEWCFFNGSELVFGKLELPKAIPLILGRDLFDFNLKLSLQPTGYQMQYYDYEKSEVYTSASSDQSISNYDKAYGELAFNESSKLFVVPPLQPSSNLTKDQKDLDNQVKLRLDQQSSGMVYLEGHSDHIGLGIGKAVTVTGTKSEDLSQGMEDFGEFVVTQVKHYIGGDGDYYNTFEALPKEASVPPVNDTIIIPVAEAEPAIVKENIDPKKLGRVRVQYHWQKGNEMTPWIRLVSSHGGKSGGFYVIPEKEDEVMIHYEQSHPDKPFALGSVYHEKAKPSDSWHEQENNIKAIKTKCGNEIILNDKGGSEEIKILNKGGTNSIILTMSDGGAISITTNNQMTLTGKNININAEENVTIDAKNVYINTQENFEVVAQQQVSTRSEAETFLVAKLDMAITSETATLQATSSQDAALVSHDAGTTVQGNGLVQVASIADSVGINAAMDVGISADANVGIGAEATLGVSSKTMTSVGSDGPVVVSGKIVQLN